MSTNDNKNGHQADHQGVHQIQDNQLNDDEAFIQSLYDELATQKPSKDEQPSKAMDEKILAAAHRSVGPSTKLVNTKRAWYVPVASAASVILVVSLFFNQLNDPVMQSEMSFSGSSSTSGNSSTVVEPEELMNDQLYDVPSSDSSVQATTEMLQVRPAMSVKSKETLIKHQGINKKTQAMKRISLKSKEEIKQFKQLHATNYSVLSNDEQLVGISKPVPEELNVNVMTEKLFNQLLGLNRYWLFVDEKKEFYLIEIVEQESDNLLYKLDKKAYYINRSMQNNKTKRSLEELGKLTEN